MSLGMLFLVLAYVLSQFYRAFLAVLSPVLGVELGASAENLAMASGLWFAAFAVMQVPVGIALDRVGPRLTASVLLAIGGAGGAAVLAMAEGAGAISLAMVLIGVGCSPVLMASYYIVARSYSPAVFATFAGVIIGVGSLGNIAAAGPTAWAIESFGWRQTIWALGAVTLLIALALALFVKNPPPPEHRARGSYLDLLRIPALWPVLIMMLVCYAPAAGIRGLWAGPYLAQVFEADITQIGRATFLMGCAMIAGNFLYGPADRLFGTRKWVILMGNLLMAGGCAVFFYHHDLTQQNAIALIAAIGLFGATFPLVMAHGRAFVPEHLTGRGVTLMNLFGIGGAGVMQFASGPVFTRLSAEAPPVIAYGQLFGLFALVVLMGCAIYLFSKDRTD